MTDRPDDRVFAGTMPEVYDLHLVPLIFESYAEDLAARLAASGPERVLEIAAGTGAATRALAAALPAAASIVATDLNQGMLDRAMARGTCRPVTWRRADVMELPFADGSFDAVVCQFGAMFFAEKGRAFAETRRVLAPGGRFVLTVWDRIEENDFADAITTALEPVFPADPPRFLARLPHGYHRTEAIRRDLKAGGFGSDPAITTLAARSRAASSHEPALAYCRGTPLGREIESRGGTGLAEAIAVAADAIARRFGPGPVDGQIQAHVVTVAR